MKYLILSLLILISTGIAAQENREVNNYSSSLSMGEILEFGNKSIKFKNVVSDSRCPKEVTCIWAGEAVVAIEVFENGFYLEEKIITIQSSNIPLKFASENILYNIDRLNLSPAPSVKNQDTSLEYKLRLNVTETAGS